MILDEARQWCEDHAAAVGSTLQACAGFTIDYGEKLKLHSQNTDQIFVRLMRSGASLVIDREHASYIRASPGLKEEL